MAGLFPGGLTAKAFDLLNGCARDAADKSMEQLLNLAALHLEDIRQASAQNLFINFTLADQIVRTFQHIGAQWEAVPSHGKPWIKGMIRYFCLSTDLESDFESPIGFDDDVEIVNACLRLAGREDLCIDPEDFDDV